MDDATVAELARTARGWETLSPDQQNEFRLLMGRFRPLVPTFRRLEAQDPRQRIAPAAWAAVRPVLEEAAGLVVYLVPLETATRLLPGEALRLIVLWYQRQEQQHPIRPLPPLPTLPAA